MRVRRERRDSDSDNFRFVKKLDMFSAGLPGFNIGGEATVTTCPGGALSILILLTTFVFGLLKLQHFIERHNPDIVINEHAYKTVEEGQFDTSNGFQIAVTLSDLIGIPLADPDYI